MSLCLCYCPMFYALLAEEGVYHDSDLEAPKLLLTVRSRSGYRGAYRSFPVSEASN
jgi:hypothetical protein